MRIRAVIFLTCILLFATPSFAGTNTDVLVMKNGDHLTCEIKQLNSGVLYVSLDYATGTIALDWKEVVRVKSKHLFHVQTEDGSRYNGTLVTVEAPCGRPVKIEVVEAPEQQVEVEQSQIVTICQTAQSFWQRFNGAMNTGIT